MNNRNVMIGAVAFVLLAAAYFFSSGQRSNLDATGGFEELVEGTLGSDDVFGLHVYQGEAEGFRLVKRGDGWFVNSHFDAPANANKLRTLLGNLETATAELRSDRSDVLDAYGLGATGVHVVLNDESGSELLHLIVGKSSGSGGFVRRDASDRALRADHNFLSDLGIWGDEIGEPKHTEWVELAAFKADRDDVQAIELHWAGQQLAFSKEFDEVEEAALADDANATAAIPTPPSYEWRVGGASGYLAKKTVADGVLGGLSNMRARDVVGPVDAAYGLGASADRAILTLADGSSSELLFGNTLEADEEQFYFQVVGEDLVWAMPAYLKSNIFKDPDMLRPE